MNATELAEYAKTKIGVTLTPTQEVKFLQACEQSIQDNESEYSQKAAAMKFLQWILHHPGWTL